MVIAHVYIPCPLDNGKSPAKRSMLIFLRWVSVFELTQEQERMRTIWKP